jgi:Uma2 family endonuclease
MQRNIRAADMNVIVTRAADGLLRRSFTVAEIRRMVEAGILAEDENFELIDGEVVPTSPKGNQHEVIKSALTEMLISLKSPELRLGVESTLYLDDRTFVEPDLCLYPKRILPEDVNGSDVVLAIEVAASSMGYDRGLKARLYARHGINEFWVVDAATRDTWVHLRPQADGQWGSIEKVDAITPVAPTALPQIAIRMADLD